MGVMTSENIRFGFARLALVAAWIVAIPWLVLLVSWAPAALHQENWDGFKWIAILLIPVCKLISWCVKIVGWIIAGFFNQEPKHLEIEQQAFRNFSRHKTVLSNFWLIACWLLMWETSDIVGKLALELDYSVLFGRIFGFFCAGIVLLVATFLLDMIVDEILIRKILAPSGADYGKYELQDSQRDFGMPFR
jgi:hypothetical protein